MKDDIASATINASDDMGVLGLQNRWLQVIIGFVISLVLGLLYAWSIFVIPLEKTFGWNRAQTSLAFTISIAFFVLGMMVGGKHADKRTPRMAVTIGATVLAAGFFMASFTNSLIMLYISYGVFCGFGIGYANVCPIAVAMRWFPDKRGLVSGILVMGFGLAAFLLGSWAGYVIHTMGWPSAFRLLGLLSLVLCVVGAQFLKYPPEGWVAPAPVSRGTSPSKSGGIGRDYNWRQMFATPTWWIWWTFHLCILTGGLMVIGHIVPYAIEGGVETAKAVAAMGVFSVCNGLGRLLIGFLWDRLGRNNTMALDGLTMVVGLLTLIFLVPLYGYGLLLLSVTCIGVAFGGAIPIASSIISSCFGNKYFGFNYGIATTPLVIGAIIGPYIGGYLHTLTGKYHYAILTSAVLAVLAIVSGLIIRDPK